MRPTVPLHTTLGFSTPDRIVVRGHDLPGELIGRLSLGGMAFLELTGRLPDADEAAVFDAIAITLVEHGPTPSVLAARLTFLGAPEAMQAAVGAGLCGLGSVLVGSTQGAAAMLLASHPRDAAPSAPAADAALRTSAATIVADHRARGAPVPGIGHPVHRPVDPRTAALFAVAARHGYAGDYVKLMGFVADEATRAYARPLPVNATGAIAAIACELGFTPRMCHGIAVFARAIGLVGHLLEEEGAPIAPELWKRAEDESRERSLADEAARR
jgi:citrate synthase